MVELYPCTFCSLRPLEGNARVTCGGKGTFSSEKAPKDTLALRNGRASAMVSHWCLAVTECDSVSLDTPGDPAAPLCVELMEKTFSRDPVAVMGWAPGGDGPHLLGTQTGGLLDMGSFGLSGQMGTAKLKPLVIIWSQTGPLILFRRRRAQGWSYEGIQGNIGLPAGIRVGNSPF